MGRKRDINVIYEQKIITACLIKGMTLKQIAQKLNCAKSSASYKTRQLFKEWNAVDRHEFVVNIFTKIISKYKNEIEKLKAIIKQSSDN